MAVQKPTSNWVKPGKGVVPMNFISPSDLSEVEIYYTAVMPGFILEQGVTSEPAYNYDAPTLNLAFPNLDLEDRDGFSGVDTITMSFLLKGTNNKGETIYHARQVLLQGEELMLPTQFRSNLMFSSGFE